MHTRNILNRWTRIMKQLLCVGVGAASVSMACAATLPDQLESTAEKHGFRQLADSELAGIRGRFAQGNSVLLFGMEMSTVWTMPTGEVFQTRADLQVDLSGAAPTVSFSPHITVTSDDAYQGVMAASGHQANVVDSGSRNANGVVQVVQAGGDFNLAGNDFRLDIDQGGNRAPAQGNGETQLTGDSGARMAVQGGSNGLGMQISVPGQGAVTQGVYAGRGVHQSIQLTGSHQQVHNMTSMQIQMSRDIQGSSPSGELRRALQSTRDLGGNY